MVLVVGVTYEVRAVVGALRERGAVAAIGGSGLLVALQLAASVRDWDVTTDAPLSIVEDALEAAGSRARFSAKQGRGKPNSAG